MAHGQKKKIANWLTSAALGRVEDPRKLIDVESGTGRCLNELSPLLWSIVDSRSPE
jgi:hypothetical protein